MSDVLFKVNCGKGNSEQVIHIDRMRKANSQLLENEIMEADETTPNASENGNTSTDFSEPEAEESEAEPSPPGKRSMFGRRIQKPVWTHDYAFSLSRQTMPNLKKTPRMDPICFHCKERVPAEEYSAHVKDCANKRWACQKCPRTFKEAIYLKRHEKNFHAAPEPSQTSTASSESGPTQEEDSDDWDNDPDVTIEPQVDDLFVGRTVRKATSPSPVPAPSKKAKVSQPADQADHQQASAAVNDRDRSVDIMYSNYEDNGRRKQSFKVVQEKEVVMESMVVLGTGNSSVGNFSLEMSDLVPKGTVMRAEDIALVCKNGCLTVKFKY